MLLAGDEFGRTQDGNDNECCQDNTISWIDWDKPDSERTFYDFVRRTGTRTKTITRTRAAAAGNDLLNPGLIASKR